MAEGGQCHKDNINTPPIKESSSEMHRKFLSLDIQRMCRQSGKAETRRYDWRIKKILKALPQMRSICYKLTNIKVVK